MCLGYVISLLLNYKLYHIKCMLICSLPGNLLMINNNKTKRTSSVKCMKLDLYTYKIYFESNINCIGVYCRSKSCKKDLWTQINTALQANTKWQRPEIGSQCTSSYYRIPSDAPDESQKHLIPTAAGVCTFPAATATIIRTGLPTVISQEQHVCYPTVIQDPNICNVLDLRPQPSNLTEQQFHQERNTGWTDGSSKSQDFSWFGGLIVAVVFGGTS